MTLDSGVSKCRITNETLFTRKCVFVLFKQEIFFIALIIVYFLCENNISRVSSCLFRKESMRILIRYDLYPASKHEEANSIKRLELLPARFELI